MKWLLWKLRLIDLVMFRTGSDKKWETRMVYYDHEGGRHIQTSSSVYDLAETGKVIVPGHSFVYYWRPYPEANVHERLVWFRPHTRRMLGRLNESAKGEQR